MDYFVEQASTDQDVQAIIRRKYGDRARILSRKEIRTGGFLGLFRRYAVEVTGYCSHAPVKSINRGTPGEERARILEQARNRENRNVPENPTNGSPQLESVLSEIRALRESITVREPAGEERHRDEPESLRNLREVMEQNEFSQSCTQKLVDHVRRECSLEELSDPDAVGSRVREWIGESIMIYPWKEQRQKPHVFVLVGPTGVGKTTTIAKLAAMYGAVADPPYDVRILTIDTYRIGALQQIQKYGEIMSIPVHAVESPEEMRKQLDLHSEADFIFIDTIGKSPNDYGKLAEVNQMVRSTGGEVHLAISATTKRTDILDIIRQFEPFNYQAVVVTKMDETSTVGGIVSALREKQKPVSFLTDGQSVPQDIERARPESFLRRLQNLPGNRPVLADNKSGVLL